MAENNYDATRPEEKEIDLWALVQKLWRSKKTIIKWCVCGAIIGLIIAFSIPKEYTTTVKLAPEETDGKTGGALSGLASMAGFSMNSGGPDAVYPDLYPDVVSSVPFMTSLFDVKVPYDSKKEKTPHTTTVENYLLKNVKSPWWAYIKAVPSKIINAIKGNEDGAGKDHSVDNFKLTEAESTLVESLNHRIKATVDNKTSVISISVTMQDPMASAILADTVVARLREYITDYRTNKARKDLEYAEQLNDEARQNYYRAQQKYADYLDRNEGLILYSAQTVRDRLENEAALAFNLYNQTSQQVQKAQAKVQENTPVYTVIQPASVPLKQSAPKKMMILIAFTFLAFIGSVVWVLFVRPIYDRKRAKKGDDDIVTIGADE